MDLFRARTKVTPIQIVVQSSMDTLKLDEILAKAYNSSSLLPELHIRSCLCKIITASDLSCITFMLAALCLIWMRTEKREKQTLTLTRTQTETGSYLCKRLLSSSGEFGQINISQHF